MIFVVDIIVILPRLHAVLMLLRLSLIFDYLGEYALLQVSRRIIVFRVNWFVDLLLGLIAAIDLYLDGSSEKQVSFLANR